MGKYKPNQPNPQYDQEFAEAMRLKLRLNREARAKASERAAPVESATENGLGPISRDGIIERILGETPGLTREKLEPMMREMGF